MSLLWRLFIRGLGVRLWLRSQTVFPRMNVHKHNVFAAMGGGWHRRLQQPACRSARPTSGWRGTGRAAADIIPRAPGQWVMSCLRTSGPSDFPDEPRAGERS